MILNHRQLQIPNAKKYSRFNERNFSRRLPRYLIFGYILLTLAEDCFASKYFDSQSQQGNLICILHTYKVHVIYMYRITVYIIRFRAILINYTKFGL